MRALITGIAGFTGRYMAKQLAANGYEVYGLAQDSTPVPHASRVYISDLLSKESLNIAVAQVEPDVVVHLAAIAFVAHGNVEEIYRTNVVGTRNLLEVLTVVVPSCSQVLIASSANVYGNTALESISEDVLLSPPNDYAISKLAMEHVAQLFYDRLPIVLVRPFNYTGVGQSVSFLIPKIVHHIQQRAPVIELGNLEVARDFSDVRVVVQYYQRLLECSQAAGRVFNVCSSTTYTLNQVLNMLRALSHHSFEVRVNPSFVRANEVRLLRGNRERLLATAGQVPDIPLIDTLGWMLQAPATASNV